MAIDPSLAAAHHHVGIAFQTLGRFDDAARAYQWAGELAPRRAQLHINLANARRIRCRQTLCLPASFIWCCQTLASSTPGPIPSTPASPANYEDVVSDLGGECGALWAAWEDACLAFYQTGRVVRTASSDPGPPTLYRCAIGR